ncbi:MAG: hypothetical protein KJP18_12655 [Gemmatimonadetes bacterium]|nr:hypothetical protein [Gemmatimonadota bacterium]NNK65083.1 hypothetical protein [Gemmatimonadota bacterium]
MTSHYEERMDADLEQIRAKVRKASDLVERQVHNAVQSLLTIDRDLAGQVVLGDRQVNRRIREIDHLVHAFIVRHAPSARPLRYASAVLRLDVALERVGDYAGSMGREVARLSAPAPGAVGRDIELVAQQARLMLSHALEAFHDGEAESAKGVYGLTAQVDLMLERALTDVQRAAEKGKGTLRDVFGLLRILYLLKRVAEQAENVSELTVFAITGEEKPAKVFRVLFVDESNDRASQIAEAYARKAYPESGRYSSAGRTPAETLSHDLIQFMDGRGVDVRTARPTALTPTGETPEHYHIIVVLSPEARDRLGEVPYRSTVVEWKIESDPQDLDALYKEVAIHVQDLMTTLAGPDAR